MSRARSTSRRSSRLSKGHRGTDAKGLVHREVIDDSLGGLLAG